MVQNSVHVILREITIEDIVGGAFNVEKNINFGVYSNFNPCHPNLRRDKHGLSFCIDAIILLVFSIIIPALLTYIHRKNY